jgi:hypothetical protein
MRDRALVQLQRRAVRTAMHILAEEDIARGAGSRPRRNCPRCGRRRPAPGFIEYDGVSLCNSCATGFELARLTDHSTSATDYAIGRAKGGTSRHRYAGAAETRRVHKEEPAQ